MSEVVSTYEMFYEAVAYARYSTSNQQELSIAVQLRGIEDYCKKAGIALSGMPYIDEARTGTNMQREGFTQLLTDARAGRFNTVVVYDISRGSRDVVDWFAFRKEMSELGITVLSATNTLGDLDDPNAFIQELLTVGIGQHQVLQSRQKSIAGKTMRAERGLFCGGYAPLGYDIVKGQYIINEREAVVVRMIFDMYASGKSYSQIIEAVNQTGVTGKRGQAIAPNTLHFILKNERYTGTFVWFEKQVRHMHKWVGKKNESPIRLENVIPCIVEQHTWEAVQLRMVHNKKNCTNKSRLHRVYLLSGLVRCGECNGAMGGITVTSKGKSYKSYTCLDKRRLKNCTLKNIKGDPLEAFIIEFLRTRILMPEVLTEMARKLSALSSQPSSEVETLRRELSTLDQKNTHLFTAIENGLSSNDAIARINENTARKKALEQKLAAIRPPHALNENQIRAILEQDAARLMDDPDAQAEIVKRYISKVLVFDDFVRIVVTPTFVRFSTKKASTPTEKWCKRDGSSGRARTYNISVNSRMLCH